MLNQQTEIDLGAEEILASYSTNRSDSGGFFFSGNERKLAFKTVHRVSQHCRGVME